MAECVLCKRECPPPQVEGPGGKMMKNPGGFSRRHWTDNPLEAYRKRKENRFEAQILKVERNALARSKRSPQAQLKLIAKRPGESKKEKARLLAQIEDGKNKKKRKKNASDSA